MIDSRKLMEENAKDVLLRAADLLSKRGWTQGTAVDDEGRVCAMGAIRLTTSDDYLSLAASDRLRDYVNADRVEAFKSPMEHLEGEEFYPVSVPFWNDYMCESIEDVILGMKGAAHDE